MSQLSWLSSTKTPLLLNVLEGSTDDTIGHLLNSKNYSKAEDYLINTHSSDHTQFIPSTDSVYPPTKIGDGWLLECWYSAPPQRSIQRLTAIASMVLWT